MMIYYHCIPIPLIFVFIFKNYSKYIVVFLPPSFDIRYKKEKSPKNDSATTYFSTCNTLSLYKQEKFIHKHSFSNKTIIDIIEKERRAENGTD